MSRRGPLRAADRGALSAALLLLAGLALSPACVGRSGDAGSAAPGAEGARPLARDASFDGNHRLGRSVIPRRYTLDLSIDPGRTEFSGVGSIEVEVTERLSRVRMHGSALRIERASAYWGGERRTARLVAGENGGLELDFGEELPLGGMRLDFVWSGALGERPYGLYRVEDGGRWYAFTQFEPLEARTVFPCFDQPDFKTPYRVTLRVPRAHTALTNSPQREQRRDGAGEIFEFEESDPLPTYLVAFAVGAFDLVTTAQHPPTRLVTTQGKGGLGAWTSSRVPILLAWLSDYFGQPYPYAKLDQVAVPNFGAGAMENVGLVTYREQYLLLGSGEIPAGRRRGSQIIMAHELAHMWYGNLVTMSWWDELWLNESFATWMSGKVLAELEPQLEMELDAVRHAQYTMELDSMRDARQVLQPIVDGGDIYNAFDGITYGKGAALLRMLEAWIGEEAFRAGVRRYMIDHAHGTGGTEPLLAALEAASGEPVAAILERFLDQPGTPRVSASLRCEDAGVLLDLSQTRSLPAGSEASVGEPWRVPVCVAFGVEGAGRTRQCFLLEERRQTRELATPQCPAWLHPNADEAGYLRWQLPADEVVALATRHRRALTPRERVGLAGNAAALLEAGLLPLESHLELLRGLAEEEQRQVVAAVGDALVDLAQAAVDDAMRDAFAPYVRALFDAHLAAVGLDPKPGEAEAAELEREQLLELLAQWGQRSDVRERAAEVAARFLAEPTAVEQRLLDLHLSNAATFGDPALWAALRDLLASELTPAQRTSVVRALGAFDDPLLVRSSLDLVLHGALRAQDYRVVAGAIPHTQRAAAWDWLRENFRAIAEILGPMSAAHLPAIAYGLCEKDDAQGVEEFFANLDDAPPGTARNQRLVVEAIERCARLRQRSREPLRAILAAGQGEGLGTSAD